MKIKWFSVFALFLFCLQFQLCYSQTFEKNYRTFEDELVYDAILLDSTTCIFALNSGNFNNDIYSTKLFSIETQTGNIIDSTFVEPTLPGHYFRGIFDVLKANDSLFVGIGKFATYESNEEIQYIVHFNNFLDITFDTTINIPDIDEEIQKTILTTEMKLVSVGRTLNDYLMLLCEKEINGDSIKYQLYDHPTALTATCAVDIDYKEKYHMFIYGGGIERPFDIIDKLTLNIDTTLKRPEYFAAIDAVLDDSDSTIYYVAGKQGYAAIEKFDLSFLKVNSEGVYEQFIYPNDENIYYTYKCLSPLNNHIYFAGVYPFTQNPPTLYPEQRWILLNRLNKDGSIDWQKFYKGEVNYMAHKVLATNDGGALIFSTRYDWTDPIPNQRDLHILKIDSTGYYTPLTSTEEVFEQMDKQILVYPNPAKDKVNFVFGLYQNLEISIFDLMGELILSQEYKSSATIDISYLPSGTYIYKISGENGFFEEGKLVKQ